MRPLNVAGTGEHQNDQPISPLRIKLFAAKRFFRRGVQRLLDRFDPTITHHDIIKGQGELITTMGRLPVKGTISRGQEALVGPVVPEDPDAGSIVYADFASRQKAGPPAPEPPEPSRGDAA